MAITPADRLDQRLTGHAGEDFGDTLFHFDLTFRQDVAKGFFLDVLFVDDYDTLPAEGRKKNDITYGAGLGYRF
jgi:hypothetical protein